MKIISSSEAFKLVDSSEDVECVVIPCFQFGAPLIPVDRSSLTLPTTVPAVASIGGNK